MAVELIEPVKRVEQYLYALCVMDFSNIPVPRSRLEFFAHALITGVLPEFQAETREEVYITAIVTGDYANLPLPKSRADQLLYKICLGETEIRDIELETRYEILLAYIAEHGDMPLETVLVECVNALQTIPNTVEIPVKSAILKGNTLVNLMVDYQEEKTVQYGNPPKTPNVANMTMLKPNTEYTLFYKAKYQNDGDVGKLFFRFAIDGSTISDMSVDGTNPYTAAYQQYVHKFTTPSTIDYFIFRSNGHYFLVKECVLLEGDYTQEDIPFFTGMQSVKMPGLTTTGKNLCDNSKNKAIEINHITGEEYDANNNVIVSDYIEINPLKTYTASKVTSLELGSISFRYYNNKKEYIGNSKTNEAKYVRLRQTNQNGSLNLDDILFQLEEGSIATSYEPYKANILTVNEDVELRGIGDVKDELNLITGELTQRIGEVVLDGSELWTQGGSQSEGLVRFYASPTNKKHATGKVMSSDITPYNGTTPYGVVGYENITGYSHNIHLNVNIKMDRIGVTDLTNAKQNAELFKLWLSQNPITVQYELETPIIKTVDLTIQDQDGNAVPCLSTFNDATHVSINAVDIIPQVDLKVCVDANTMANVASQQENVAVAQASLSDAIDAQNDDIEMTKQALDEVKGE